MSSKSILVISDQHAPYHHIDTLEFLTDHVDGTSNTDNKESNKKI